MALNAEKNGDVCSFLNGRSEAAVTNGKKPSYPGDVRRAVIDCGIMLLYTFYAVAV